MYYRKRFRGTLGAVSATRNCPKYFGTSESRVVYSTQTDIFCNALVETLLECGADARYDSANGFTFINGLPLSIVYTSSTGFYIFCPCHGASLTSASQTSYQPFNSTAGSAYDFYITIKGDPLGIMDIYWGSLTTPGNVNKAYSFSVGRGKDLRNDNDIAVLSKAQEYSGVRVFKITNEGADFVEGATTDFSMAFGYTINNLDYLSDNKQKIPLVPTISNNGCFRINNTYYGDNALTADTFYQFDDEVFYVRDAYTIVKCSTPTP